MNDVTQGGGLLVLLRHGKSSLNEEDRFSGWSDCPLAPEGVRQAQEAGRALRDAGIVFDACFTSVLSRAVDTADVVLGEMGLADISTTRTWKLNERHYGALEGLLKKEVEDRYGPDRVEAWRNTADAVPPPLGDDDPRHPRNRTLFRDIAPDILPSTECLRDAFGRVTGFFEEQVCPLIRSGGRVLVVSHGNPIRAIIAHLDGLPAGEIPRIGILNAIPIVYRANDAGGLAFAESWFSADIHKNGIQPNF